MTNGGKMALFVGIAAILVIVILSAQRAPKVTPTSNTASNVDSIFGFGTALIGAGEKIFAPSQQTDDSEFQAGHFGVDYS